MPDPTVELDRAAADIPLTRSAREILERAAATANTRGTVPTPIDVLRATLTTRGSLADEAIRAVGVDPAVLLPQLSADGAEVQAIPLRQLLVNANREAQVLGHYHVDSIHLLLAMLYSDSQATACKGNGGRSRPRGPPARRRPAAQAAAFAARCDSRQPRLSRPGGDHCSVGSAALVWDPYLIRRGAHDRFRHGRLDHIGVHPRVRPRSRRVPRRRPERASVRLPRPQPAALLERAAEPRHARAVPAARRDRAAGRRGLHRPRRAAQPRVGFGGVGRRPGRHPAVRSPGRDSFHDPGPRRVDHTGERRLLRGARLPWVHRGNSAGPEPASGAGARRLRHPSALASVLSSGPGQSIRSARHPDGVRRTVVLAVFQGQLLSARPADHNSLRHRPDPDHLRPGPHGLSLVSRPRSSLDLRVLDARAPAALKPASRGPALRRCPRATTARGPHRCALLLAPPFPWLRPSRPRISGNPPVA